MNSEVSSEDAGEPSAVTPSGGGPGDSPGSLRRRAAQSAWTLIWTTVYLLYLATILVFAATGWGSWLNGEQLGRRLEFASGVALIVSYFISWLLFMVQPPERQSWLDKLAGSWAVVVFVVGTVILLDIVFLKRLTIQSHFAIVFGFAIVLTLIDWIQHIRSADEPRGPVNLKATLVAADIPLLIGLGLVMLVAHSQLTLQHDMDLFLGGALAFKLAFYYGAFCLVNAFLPMKVTQRQES